MLGPIYDGPLHAPIPALYRIPDEIWLLVLSHLPHTSRWLSPNLGYDDAFLAPLSPSLLKSSFQASNHFVELEYASWLQTIEAACTVCAAWYVELRPRMDEWVLFRSPSHLRRYIRSRPPVQDLGIRRVDIHYQEQYPDADVAAFLRGCTALEQLHMNQLNNYLSFDMPLSVLALLAHRCPHTLTSLGFPKRGVPIDALVLLAQLQGLDQLAVGCDKFELQAQDMSALLSLLGLSTPHPVPLGTHIRSLRIDMPVLTRVSDFLFNYLPASCLPRLEDLTLTTVETPFRMPATAGVVRQPFSTRALEPFFSTHGPKLRSAQFALADAAQHGHFCRLAGYCTQLRRLALPACEHTREAAPGWRFAHLHTLALTNFMHTNKENALQIPDHWRNVVSLVSCFTQPAPARAEHFPRLAVLRLADVVPWHLRADDTPLPPVHQVKLARKVVELCAAAGQGTVDVLDCAGDAVCPERLAGRWPVDPSKVRVLAVGATAGRQSY